MYKFDEKRHIHTLNDKPLMGITTVLGVIAKPALIPWAVKMMEQHIQNECSLDKDGNYQVSVDELTDAKKAYTRTRDKAGDFGTEVHKLIEQSIKEGKFVKSDNEMVNKALENFTGWVAENKVKFLESEKHLYSEKMWTGGIVDIVCEIDGEIYIADIKTSSGIYPEMMLQMAGYHLMLDEMKDYDVKGYIVVNLNKKGGIKVQKTYAVDEKREAFLSALNLYKTLKNWK